MQDHFFVDDDGTRTAVADLPTWLIRELLRDGVDVIRDVTEDQFMERLRIELVARRLDA